MKIVILGSNGQLGHELSTTMQSLGEVISLDRSRGDLSLWHQLSLTLKGLKPDVIVNAAAYTAVDKAEEEQGLAYLINAETPGKLAQFCKESSTLLIHYSTDYVFSGQEGEAPYGENDALEPLNIYGASKALGEKVIMESACSYFILRTSWVYALRGHNFIKTMLNLAEQRESLKVVGDQFSAPTSAESLALLSTELLSLVMQKRAKEGHWRSGLYHACAPDHTSWHGLATAALSFLRPKLGDKWALKSEADIVSISSSEFPLPARRPLDSRMSPASLKKDWGLEMPSWKAQLQLCFQPWMD